MAKLTAYQIEQHLAKNLAPIYLVSGDEHLLVQETTDLIRKAARKSGFTERVSLTVDSNTDWGKLLYSETHSFSLFATRRIIEIPLAQTKPNAEASKILQSIATNPLPDTLILLSSQKIDSKTEKTAWYKAIEKNGVTIPIWPLTLDQLPNWITQRAKKAGLQFTADAAKQLAEQVEGNLLAAAQEIEKLQLLQITGVIDAQTITTTVTDNARFDIFQLVDCALSGNSQRCLRILSALQMEGTEAILILWALTRELRTLAALLKQNKQRGVALGQLFQQYRIWEKRQPVVRRFLQQHSLQSCWGMLLQGANIDKIIKGLATGNAWQELQELTLKMAGSGILL